MPRRMNKRLDPEDITLDLDAPSLKVTINGREIDIDEYMDIIKTRAEANMKFLDGLPKEMREAIQYAETPTEHFKMMAEIKEMVNILGLERVKKIWDES